ncbi:MAG: prephenate dehydrogenase/arogenate dehydrogenase family protein [Candidatus Omnitrophica bacterium]|nr:prephenate dehydrogenase/arogenate dehydrogenase family protein [Candidatus Omnitrophota bacterium]
MRLRKNPLLFRKVTVIGIGLLGGSLAVAMKKNHLAREVVGVSRRQAALNFAVKNRIVDSGTNNIVKAVENADFVILATPIQTILSLLTSLGPHLKRGCIITDIGSTKTSIVQAAQKHLPNHVLFVGGHPLAGSEKKGVEFSDAALFNQSFCLLTPTDKTNKDALDKVSEVWTRVGSIVKIVSPDEHDSILAHTSHIPHLLAYGLIDSIPSNYLMYGATGLKDTTRIASSTPELWSDICMQNSKNILKSLDEVVKVLASYRKAISVGDENALTDFFKKAKEKRDTLK